MRTIRLAVLASAAGVLLAAAVGCGSGRPEAADAAGPACGERVLEDWADGRIDATYPADCYLDAIDLLPEDVRTYTSAEEDIARAMTSLEAPGGGSGTMGPNVERRLSASSTDVIEPSAGGSLREPPLPVYFLAALAVALLASGVAAVAARRARREG